MQYNYTGNVHGGEKNNTLYLDQTLPDFSNFWQTYSRRMLTENGAPTSPSVKNVSKKGQFV